MKPKVYIETSVISYLTAREVKTHWTDDDQVLKTMGADVPSGKTN